MIKSYKDGMGAKLAHDLILTANKWNGTLNVDADNLSGAIRLYRKAGMQPSPSATEWSKTLSQKQPR